MKIATFNANSIRSRTQIILCGEFRQNSCKKVVFLRNLKKYYINLRFFLNISTYICDNMCRKPAKPLSSDTLNLVGVSFLGESYAI